MDHSLPQQCPSCLSAGTMFAALGRFPVFRCTSCGLFFFARGATGEAPHTDLWYQEFVPSSDACAAAAGAHTHTTYARQLSALEKLTHGRTLLDFGCGVGSFLAAAKLRGWSVYGIENNAAAVAFVTERFNIPCVGRTGELPQRQFDVIRISHTIEHLTDPRPLIEEFYRLLAPNGILVVICPNAESLCYFLLHRIEKLFTRTPRFYGALIPNMHLLGFSTRSIARLGTLCGFTPVRVFTVSPGNATYYPLGADPLLLRTTPRNPLSGSWRYWLPLHASILGTPFGLGEWVVGYFRKPS